MECTYWIYVNELGTQLLGFSWGPCQNLDIPCCIIILPIHQTCHFGVFPFYGKPHTKSNGVWQYISLDSKKCHEHIPQQIRNMHAKMREFWGVYPQQIRKIHENPWVYTPILQQDPEAVAVARQLEARDRAGKIWNQRWGAEMIGGKTGLKWWEVLVTASVSICLVCLLWFCSNMFKLFQYFTLIDNTSFQNRMNI